MSDPCYAKCWMHVVLYQVIGVSIDAAATVCDDFFKKNVFFARQLSWMCPWASRNWERSNTDKEKRKEAIKSNVIVMLCGYNVFLLVT